MASANRHPLLQINTLWWFLSLIFIYIQKVKADMNPLKKYWRLRILESYWLKAFPCMLRHVYSQVTGLFINTYLHLRNQSQISIHSRVITIKECSNPIEFLGMCSHVCSEVIDCACFFYSCLSTSKKWMSDVNLFKRYWRLQNSNVLMALNSTSVTTKAIVLFFKKEN